MTAEHPALTRSWPVGRFTCTLTVPPVKTGAVYAAIEWEPHRPEELTRDEIAAYRRGRNQALAELTAELGIRGPTVEV